VVQKDLSIDYSKTLTRRFGFSVGGDCQWQIPDSGPVVRGWDNLALGAHRDLCTVRSPAGRGQNGPGAMKAWCLAALFCAPILAGAATTGAPRADGGRRVVIRYAGTGFVPMAAEVTVGTRLSVVNPGDHVLDLSLVTPHGRPRGRFRVPPHGAVTLRLKRPGVEILYDADTTAFGGLRVGGAAVRQPRARPGSADFPIPAYAVIAVTDTDGGGVPVSARRTVAVPGTTMTFRPWVLVVRSGAVIRFINHDDMLHAVRPGAYRILYDDHGRLTNRRPRFQGFYLYPDGGEGRLAPRRPGLYGYYCFLHATPVAHSYIPCGSYGKGGYWVIRLGAVPAHRCRVYGGFPYVMDGWILVEPRRS
jgi:plastocyanin